MSTKKSKAGRKLQLTPELQKKLTDQLKVAGTLEDAAAFVGIGKSTLFAWLAKGRAQKKGPYREFLEATNRALQERRVLREQLLIKASTGPKGDWRATAWLMERTEPQRYAPRVVHHVREELSNAIERLTEEFADQPELLERALAALTGAGGGGEAPPDPLGEGGTDDPGSEAVQPPPAKP